MTNRRSSAFLILIVGLAACSRGQASGRAASGGSSSGHPSAATAAAETLPPEVQHPYDENAVAQTEIDAAIARARTEHKRVLLVFGGNWCVWCRRIEHVFRNHPAVSGALSSKYIVVHIDTGARRSGKNADVAGRYGDPVRFGLPALVVVDSSGEVVVVQETSSLEEGNHHDPARILAFLERYAPAT